MTEEVEDLGETLLHLAGTKPAMVPIINVPWISMIVLIGVTAEMAEIYWRLAVVALPLWPIALFIFRKDHNGMRVLATWAMTAGIDMRANRFGATSIEVFPTTYRGRFRGIPNA